MCAMNSLLRYPFDAQIIMKKRKSIKNDLLASEKQFHENKVVLGSLHSIRDTVYVTFK